jgi:uncharacterized protein (DUF305 family)
MTENKEFVYTKEWLEQKLENDRMAEEKAEEQRKEERERENIRSAWKQQTGVEPTKAELEKALVEKRHQDVAHAARVNERYAAESIRSKF